MCHGYLTLASCGLRHPSPMLKLPRDPLSSLNNKLEALVRCVAYCSFSQAPWTTVSCWVDSESAFFIYCLFRHGQPHDQRSGGKELFIPTFKNFRHRLAHDFFFLYSSFHRSACEVCWNSPQYEKHSSSHNAHTNCRCPVQRPVTKR